MPSCLLVLLPALIGVSVLNCRVLGSSTVILICGCRVLSTTETWSSLWLLVTILLKEQCKKYKSRSGGFLECMGKNSNIEVLDLLDFNDLL